MINGKKMDAGRFLYNLGKPKEELLEDFTSKAEEFFEWYSHFQNPDPISVIQICSCDFVCDNKCAIPLSNKFTVIGVLIPHAFVKKLLTKLGDKYNMQIEISDDQ